MTPRDYERFATKLKSVANSDAISYIVSVQDIKTGLIIHNLRHVTNIIFNAIETARLFHSDNIHATDVQVVLETRFDNDHTIYTHGADRVITVLTHMQSMEKIMVETMFDLFDEDEVDEPEPVLKLRSVEFPVVQKQLGEDTTTSNKVQRYTDETLDELAVGLRKLETVKSTVEAEEVAFVLYRKLQSLIQARGE